MHLKMSAPSPRAFHPGMPPRQIQIQGLLSTEGSQQGCPLGGLLFILSIASTVTAVQEAHPQVAVVYHNPNPGLGYDTPNGPFGGRYAQYYGGGAWKRRVTAQA
jgi:hypothetical protein